MGITTTSPEEIAAVYGRTDTADLSGLPAVGVPALADEIPNAWSTGRGHDRL